MSRVETVTSIAEQSALGTLLNRWPVVCQVDGERALPELIEREPFPACILVLDGVIEVRLPGSVTEQLEAGDLLVIHETDGVTLREPSHEALSARTNWRIDQPH